MMFIVFLHKFLCIGKLFENKILQKRFFNILKRTICFLDILLLIYIETRTSNKRKHYVISNLKKTADLSKK